MVEPGGVSVELTDEFGENRNPDAPIYAVFFLVSDEDNPSQHLRLLAQLAGRLDQDNFIDDWLSANHEQALKETLLRDDRYVSLHLLAHTPMGELIGKPVRTLEIPHGCLIAMIRRGELTFVPWGDTVLGEGDWLTIIGDAAGIETLRTRYKKGV